METTLLLRCPFLPFLPFSWRFFGQFWLLARLMGAKNSPSLKALARSSKSKSMLVPTCGASWTTKPRSAFDAESTCKALEKEVEARTTERDGANRGVADERDKRAIVENQLAKLRAQVEAGEKKCRERTPFIRRRAPKSARRPRANDAKSDRGVSKLAQDILEKKIDKFDTEGCKRMKETLSPLDHDIKAFRERVEKINTDAAGRNAALTREIELLKENAVKMSEDADNFVRALKGDSQVLGYFGELVLEHLLKDAGLRSGKEYMMQCATRDDEGRSSRPDCRIVFPDANGVERHLIIDAKASLTDWHDYVNAKDNEARSTAIKKHVRAVRRHVDGLSDKHYASLPGTKQPHFVFMFMPIEPAHIAALTEDSALFGYACDKNVILASRATLMPTLLVVGQIWKHERQNRNARDVADRAGKIYDKVRVFLKHFEDVGKALKSASVKYHDANNNLTTGSGNLVWQVEQLEDLGANIKKSLPVDIRTKAVEEVPGDKSE